MNRAILITGILLSLSSTQATAEDKVNDWNEKYGNAMTTRDKFSDNYDKEGYTDRRRDTYSAKIGSTVTGKQRLYFQIESNTSIINFSQSNETRLKQYLSSITGIDRCDPADYSTNDKNAGPLDSVWKFNGVNVRMLEWCEESELKLPFGGNGQHYWYINATTYTDKGNNYVTNTFKVAKEPIKIKASTGEVFAISAKGFTKVWNNFGGDAL
ncbi:hypothetical protein [Vibrio sp. TBV020]|uniref:hypothetical protein n=1 Tax=Vibrio sp. TBV020 TaxID=3137398 RepID=UPI0038CDB360